MADAADASELREYLDYLTKDHLNMYGSVESIAKYAPTVDYAPTIEGWQKVEPTLSSGSEPDRCFVAIWFDDSMDAVYNAGFEMAITDCGFKAYRVKVIQPTRALLIRSSRGFGGRNSVVADFTGQRQSVYYEAGFAVGLGREVIGCCQDGHTEGLAFDTRHLGHIVWTDSSDLRTKLANSIRANIIPRR